MPIYSEHSSSVTTPFARQSGSFSSPRDGPRVICYMSAQGI